MILDVKRHPSTTHVQEQYAECGLYRDSEILCLGPSDSARGDARRAAATFLREPEAVEEQSGSRKQQRDPQYLSRRRPRGCRRSQPAGSIGRRRRSRARPLRLRPNAGRAPPSTVVSRRVAVEPQVGEAEAIDQSSWAVERQLLLGIRQPALRWGAAKICRSLTTNAFNHTEPDPTSTRSKPGNRMPIARPDPCSGSARFAPAVCPTPQHLQRANVPADTFL